jgi:hypothetical protein
MDRHLKATQHGRPAWTALALAAVAVTLLMAGPASADTTFSYSLNDPNTAVSPYPGPYGTVAVDLIDSTHATITLTANTVTQGSSTYYYLFGDGGTLGLNVSGTFNGVVPPGGWVNGVGSSTPTVAGSGNEDGFGKFNFTVDNGTGAADALSKLIVDLTATGSTNWASAATVLTQNDHGASVAGHVFVYDSPPTDASHTALTTGFAADAGIATPEPASFAMAGTAVVVGLGIALRRRRAVI